MDALLSGLPYIQITLAVLLTGAILMQQRGAGLGSAFGGGDGAVHYERRGGEKTLFQTTVVLAVAFVIVTALPIIITTPNQTVTETATTTNTINDVEVTTENGEVINVETIPNTPENTSIEEPVDNFEEIVNE